MTSNNVLSSRAHRARTTASIMIMLGAVPGTALAAAPAPIEPAAPPPARETSMFHPDFDGDGFADLATGSPSGSVASAGFAGYVTVLYGSAEGLTGAHSQRWSKDTADVPGVAEQGDRFGAALTFGDIDGDGFDDLVATAPGETRGGMADAGAAYVIFGSAEGLVATGSQVWAQDSPGIVGAAADSDLFGHSALARDFDRDGFADLAVGATGEGVGREGGVNVLYGTADGLAADRNQLWQQVGELPEQGDEFGSSLTAGNYDSDPYRDLVIGARLETVDGQQFAGAVTVLYGTANGLSDERGTTFTRETPGVKGTALPFDFFGTAGATGDFDGDGYDDVAVSASGSHESVSVLHGSSAGLSPAGNELWRQRDFGLDEGGRDGEAFGHDIAAGDLNGDGRSDLAVGIPWEKAKEGLEVVPNVGAVLVLLGQAGGFRADAFQYVENIDWSDPSTRNDHYGTSVTASDFDGDGRADLAVAIPESDVARVDAGAIEVRYGTAAGAGDPVLWHLDSAGVVGKAEARSQLGALADR